MGAGEHKDAARDFLAMIMARRIDEAYDKHVSPALVHHNPWFASDAASLRKAMSEAHAKMPETTIDVKNVVAEGDLVAVHSRVTHQKGEPGLAVVHIFRFDASGKIVELWDVGQPVPRGVRNANGMF